MQLKNSTVPTPYDSLRLEEDMPYQKKKKKILLFYFKPSH